MVPTTILFAPSPAGSIGSFSVKSWSSSRVTGALTIGTTNTYTSTIPGQVVQKTFSGTAGQQLGLTLSSFTTSVSGATLYAVVQKPDGTQLTSTTFTAANTTPVARVLDLPVLPTTGTYTVQVFPYNNYYADLTTTFSGSVRVTADVSGTLATNGTATAVSLTQAGQTARLTFTGTAGQDWVVQLSIVVDEWQQSVHQLHRVPPRWHARHGRQLLSDGLLLRGKRGVAGQWYLHHIVCTRSPADSIGSFSVKSWSSSRVTGALTIGTTNTYTSTIPGQVVQKTFSGTAGQQLGLTLSSFTTSVSGATLYAVVQKPDGTQLTSTTFTAANTTPVARVLDLPVLPTTGTYTVQVFPYNNYYADLTTTFSGSVRVTADVSGTLATNGTATAVSLAQAGQTARRRPSLAPRDRIWVVYVSSVVDDVAAIRTLTITDVSPRWHARHEPASCYPTGNGCAVSAYALPASGTYEIVFTPQSDGHQRQLQCAGVGIESGHRHLNGGHRQHLHQHDCGAGGAEDLQRHRRRATRADAVGLYHLSQWRHAQCDCVQARWHAAHQQQLYGGADQPDGRSWLDLPVLPTTGSYTVQVLPYQYELQQSSDHHLQWLGVGDCRCERHAGYQRHRYCGQLAQAGQTARLTFSWHRGTRSDGLCIERSDDGADRTLTIRSIARVAPV